MSEEEKQMTRKIKQTMVAQGDVLIVRVSDVAEPTGAPIARDPDGAVVLQRGEVTGHRHAIYGSPHVAFFRDDGLARGVPSDLYIGHLKISGEAADLKHEEHGTITLEPGTYVVRRQTEYPAREHRRVVAD